MTKAPSRCSGVKKYRFSGRDVYAEADQPTRDAMDLAYLTGQRPQDTLSHDERDMRDNFPHIDQGKTGQKLRIGGYRRIEGTDRTNPDKKSRLQGR